MNHGSLDVNTAKGLKLLRSRIEKAEIPPTKLDETLKIATWNIREFGRRPRKTASLHYIAEIIGQFDVVSIVELRDNLGDLKQVMDYLGPYWSVIFSDFNTDSAGNRERIGYVFDKRAAVFTGLASESDPPRKKDKKTGEYVPEITWWRSPFMASFRAASFDFILIAAHIRWGSGAEARVEPLKMLAEWLDKRRKEKYVYDKDLILMGDFNIPDRQDPTFKAITSSGMMVPAGLLKGDFGTNLAKDKRYDQILHFPLHEQLFTGKGGALDFYCGDHAGLFPGQKMTKEEFTFQLSDHLPLWIQLDTWNEDIELDQILNR